MAGIREIHESVFEYLKNWSERARHHEENIFFYMRSIRDERFKKGFWFPGNEDYLCVSFWKGGDSFNKTPNVYLEINKKLGCSVIFTSKDSKEKLAYFNDLVGILNNDPDENKYKKLKGGWRKKYSSNYMDCIFILDYFINNDKKVIDEFIIENGEPQVEFTQPFGLLNAYDFENTLSKVLKERDRLMQMAHERQIALQSRPNIPLAIESVSIENYQGIINTEINDLPLDANWIFITGENGYGKTTVLQAIALGLNNAPELTKYLEEKTVIRLGLIYEGEKEYVARSIQSGNVSTDSIDYRLLSIGYGPARLNVQARSSENLETKGQNNVLSLFETDVLLKNINYELFTSKNSVRRNFEFLSEAIREVTNDRIYAIEFQDAEPIFRERLSNGDILPPQKLKHLAAGFRNIINLVGDIIVRFSSQKVDNYKDFRGVVIIDEIENHLHPILQRELPSTLTRVFPKLQFIASTHSPIPFLGAPTNTVFLKVDRDLENGVTLQKINLQVDIATLLPDAILTSPLFGFDEIISDQIQNLNQINTSNTYSEAQMIDELKSKFLKPDVS